MGTASPTSPSGGPGTDGLLTQAIMGEPVVGDLTGDGYPELTFVSGDGAIGVLLGTPRGLGAKSVQWAVPPGARSIQPLSGAGAEWLVVAQPMEPVSGKVAAGLVTCMRAGPGPVITESITWHQDSPGIKGVAESEDLWGWATG
jgi:hypothetical protein